MNSRLVLSFIAGLGTAIILSRYTDEGRKLISGGNKFFSN